MLTPIPLLNRCGGPVYRVCRSPFNCRTFFFRPSVLFVRSFVRLSFSCLFFVFVVVCFFVSCSCFFGLFGLLSCCGVVWFACFCFCDLFAFCFCFSVFLFFCFSLLVRFFQTAALHSKVKELDMARSASEDLILSLSAEKSRMLGSSGQANETIDSLVDEYSRLVRAAPLLTRIKKKKKKSTPPPRFGDKTA